jgi:multimeric flavodoxin WrbA
MKALLINGSPNAKWCTYTSLTEVEKTLNEACIDTEIIQVGNKDLRGCIGCRQCKKNGKCVFNDLVNETAPIFEACDGIVIGSPVYFASANGTLISFIDRLFYSVSFDKTMKVGAAVVSSRRGGASATFDEINKYFTISNMPIAASQYWNSVHGYTPEDVYADEEGCQTMRILGRNMAFLIKSIQLGKEKFGLPEKEERKMTNFNSIR